MAISNTLAPGQVGLTTASLRPLQQQVVGAITTAAGGVAPDVDLLRALLGEPVMPLPPPGTSAYTAATGWVAHPWHRDEPHRQVGHSADTTTTTSSSSSSASTTRVSTPAGSGSEGVDFRKAPITDANADADE